MISKLVFDALRMALWSRRPAKGELIHHSDRGVQCAGRTFRQLLESHGLEGSMSLQRGLLGQYDGGEFFGSLKSEIVHWRSYQTREEARGDIVAYITMF